MPRKSLLIAIVLFVFGFSATTTHAATPMLALSTQNVGGHACALTRAGQVVCWGYNVRGALGVTAGLNDYRGTAPQIVPLPSAAIQIGAGDAHTCALLENHTAYCWGINSHGQLGNLTNVGSSAANPNPALVQSGSPIVRIDVGYDSSCFIHADGTAKCAGGNGSGQLGLPESEMVLTPTTMPLAGSVITRIAIGGDFTCALLSSRTVKCMGSNSRGQLADDAHLGSADPAPVSASLPPTVVDVDAGRDHACATLTDKSAWCWGSDEVGQLGDGTHDFNANFDPFQVPVGETTAVAAGNGHTCTLGPGAVRCWGVNVVGELGVPNGFPTVNPNPSPIVSSFDANSSFIAAGGAFTCAIRPDGSVQCAGDNMGGQLGVPRTTLGSSWTPLTVPGVNVFASAPKLPLAVKRPKLRFRKSGSKVAVTSRVTVSGVGAPLHPADCAGKVTSRLETKRKSRYRKVVSRTVSLNVKRGFCGFDVRLNLASKYVGKKLMLRLIVKDGATTTGFDKRFTAKIKRPRR